MAKLVVAIGNPGREYENTRHNLGFLLADRLVKEFKGSPFQLLSKCHALVSLIDSSFGTLIFIKPMTFVNLSGKSVSLAKKYFNIDLGHVLVLVDDVNRSFGKLRLCFNGGSGGHNGIKSITTSLGSSEYWQLRCGLGRPSEEGTELSDFVLGKFSEEENLQLNSVFIEATTLFNQWCSEFETA
ncbi:Peptidyl-tRNA hydrolase,peptidyl-tRNA hydrolase,Peptidyl-tRNA hydrolase,peptidyl-tRNA hydrolase,Peptidyl-tRNA hydrolase [Chlamydia serpentis]|uniref:Peptidyl-tRNA hydrolase n=1 Tax=Chlamydia serpentis TaxID=1967782 RepID=A0A2R8FCD5_9CHLA|nr:aminoacyl-tRNA hydrolase [Chlamydia serpentis]SPN74058.1 Peptidyl-tRNA hydrolase,peptidyl-tRNA hydrolase,Peptidyl-tRNA hydrolase,peptidyl-tRNA hydrolase,Peptidyl-tRNA hydrolase [Chlamydia serpentis]